MIVFIFNEDNLRIEELKNKTDEEQSEMIRSCQRCETKEILDYPTLLEGKVLLFRGNYDGLATDRLCARIIEHLPAEDRWKVSDVRLFDLDKTEFWHHFTRLELEEQFRPFCEGKGFIVDK